MPDSTRDGGNIFGEMRRFARTSGAVPYLSAYIWFTPQGSYREGTSNTSAPA